MAIDTRDKRMSIITLSSPVPAVFPNPDGTIGTQDRAMWIWLYHGLALASAVSPSERSLFKAMSRAMWKKHQ